MIKKNAINTALLLTLIVPFASHAASTCGGDSTKYRILPDEIGREGDVFKTPFVMPCDSMLVPEGSKTVIHPSSMLYYRDTSTSLKKITVRGTLIAEGTASEPIFFCGSIKKNNTLGYIPGDAVWQGIELESGGKIEFKNVRFIRASSALIVFSPNITVYNAQFKGTPSLILPDTLLFLTMPEAKVDTLELKGKFFRYRAGKTKNANQESSANSPPTKNSITDTLPITSKSDSQPKKGISKNEILWYSLGGAALLSAAGVTYMALQKEPGSPNNPVQVSETDPAPTLPTTPNPR